MEHPIAQKILPYTLLVGQEKLKLALELAYIVPRIGGVLLSGQRGTGKSTAVRAFSVMMEKITCNFTNKCYRRQGDGRLGN
ncbi:MAG: hypothetical protein MK289_14160 [Trichodesmium sp. ALOHA_ZT_67]|nr:hypothetical protein [Trichodesmium sp. ALOHA_ZT_67]